MAPAGRKRTGSVLVFVLVVVMLLSLAAYRFTETMVAEATAASAHHREVEARAFADSGIEWAAVLLGDRLSEETTVDLYNNPSLFQGVLMRDADSDAGRGRFSIVAPDDTQPYGQTLRFGLVDESARLNLNALLGLGLDDEQLRDVLLALPEMTVEIADAILDWIDEDEQPRQFGAENEYYGTLDPPYTARNGPLTSLNELLKVRDVTPWLLYGEDANRNGLLDPNEDDGQETAPLDDGDGVLWRGWSAFLTVHGREANRMADGSPRINVNQNDLAALYDQLLEAFDEDVALFVTAYRLNGPRQASGSGGSGQGGGAGGSGGSGGRGGGGSAQPQQGGQGGVNIGASGAGTGGSSPRQSGGSGSVQRRGGLELSGGGQQQIGSLYELIDAEVEAEINGQQQVLESPWSSDSSDLQTTLPQLLDALTVSSEPFIEGRINIYQAPQEVLYAIPDIDDQVVQAILGVQASAGGTDPALDTTGTRSTTAWLLFEGIVDLEEMRRLDRYITTGGDVYRLQVVGYWDGGGPASRLEAIIDATELAPRVVSVRDLTPLGRGYWPEQLGSPAGMP